MTASDWASADVSIKQSGWAYACADVGVPLLKVGAEGDSLAADDVDEGQADGGPKPCVQLLDDLLLVLDHKEGAGCCPAHDARPDDDQQQGLHVSQSLKMNKEPIKQVKRY